MNFCDGRQYYGHNNRIYHSYYYRRFFRQKKTCRRCGKYGYHRQNQCDARFRQCFSCLNYGHLQRVCYSRNSNRLRQNVEIANVTSYEREHNSNSSKTNCGKSNVKSKIPSCKSERKKQRDNKRILDFNERKHFARQMPFSKAGPVAFVGCVSTVSINMKQELSALKSQLSKEKIAHKEAKNKICKLNEEIQELTLTCDLNQDRYEKFYDGYYKLLKQYDKQSTEIKEYSVKTALLEQQLRNTRMLIHNPENDSRI